MQLGQKCDQVLKERGWRSGQRRIKHLYMLFVSLVVVGICEVFVAVGYNAARQGEAAYAFAGRRGPKLNEYQLDGRWMREEEALVLRSSRGTVRQAPACASC